MRSACRPLSGLFLAALWLAWSCIGSAGLLSTCHGDGEEACSHGLVQVWTGSCKAPNETHGPCPEENPCRDDAPAPCEGETATDHSQCGCPPDHYHELITLEMGLPMVLTMMPPVWKEITLWPKPPGPAVRRFPPALPVLPKEAESSIPLPLHLLQGPLRI
jgi:hypothetical protein